MSYRTRVNVRQLEDRLAVSKQTIWRWYSSGDFPRPHYLGQNRLWWLDEIEAWEQRNTNTVASPAVATRGRDTAA